MSGKMNLTFDESGQLKSVNISGDIPPDAQEHVKRALGWEGMEEEGSLDAKDLNHPTTPPGDKQDFGMETGDPSLDQSHEEHGSFPHSAPPSLDPPPPQEDPANHPLETANPRASGNSSMGPLPVMQDAGMAGGPVNPPDPDSFMTTPPPELSAGTVRDLYGPSPGSAEDGFHVAPPGENEPILNQMVQDQQMEEMGASPEAVVDIPRGISQEQFAQLPPEEQEEYHALLSRMNDAIDGHQHQTFRTLIGRVQELQRKMKSFAPEPMQEMPEVPPPQYAKSVSGYDVSYYLGREGSLRKSDEDSPMSADGPNLRSAVSLSTPSSKMDSPGSEGSGGGLSSGESTSSSTASPGSSVKQSSLFSSGSGSNKSPGLGSSSSSDEPDLSSFPVRHVAPGKFQESQDSGDSASVESTGSSGVFGGSNDDDVDISSFPVRHVAPSGPSGGSGVDDGRERTNLQAPADVFGRHLDSKGDLHSRGSLHRMKHPKFHHSQSHARLVSTGSSHPHEDHGQMENYLHDLLNHPDHAESSTKLRELREKYGEDFTPYVMSWFEHKHHYDPEHPEQNRGSRASRGSDGIVPMIQGKSHNGQGAHMFQFQEGPHPVHHGYGGPAATATGLTQAKWQDRDARGAWHQAIARTHSNEENNHPSNVDFEFQGVPHTVQIHPDLYEDVASGEISPLMAYHRTMEILRAESPEKLRWGIKDRENPDRYHAYEQQGMSAGGKTKRIANGLAADQGHYLDVLGHDGSLHGEQLPNWGDDFSRQQHWFFHTTQDGFLGGMSDEDVDLGRIFGKDNQSLQDGFLKAARREGKKGLHGKLSPSGYNQRHYLYHSEDDDAHLGARSKAALQSGRSHVETFRNEDGSPRASLFRREIGPDASDTRPSSQPYVLVEHSTDDKGNPTPGNKWFTAGKEGQDRVYFGTEHGARHAIDLFDRVKRGQQHPNGIHQAYADLQLREKCHPAIREQMEQQFPLLSRIQFGELPYQAVEKEVRLGTGKGGADKTYRMRSLNPVITDEEFWGDYESVLATRGSLRPEGEQGQGSLRARFANSGMVGEMFPMIDKAIRETKNAWGQFDAKHWRHDANGNVDSDYQQMFIEAVRAIRGKFLTVRQGAMNQGGFVPNQGPTQAAHRGKGERGKDHAPPGRRWGAEWNAGQGNSFIGSYISTLLRSQGGPLSNYYRDYVDHGASIPEDVWKKEFLDDWKQTQVDQWNVEIGPFIPEEEQRSLFNEFVKDLRGIGNRSQAREFYRRNRGWAMYPQYRKKIGQGDLSERTGVGHGADYASQGRREEIADATSASMGALNPEEAMIEDQRRGGGYLDNLLDQVPDLPDSQEGGGGLEALQSFDQGPEGGEVSEEEQRFHNSMARVKHKRPWEHLSNQSSAFVRRNVNAEMDELVDQNPELQRGVERDEDGDFDFPDNHLYWSLYDAYQAIMAVAVNEANLGVDKEDLISLGSSKIARHIYDQRGGEIGSFGREDIENIAEMSRKYIEPLVENQEIMQALTSHGKAGSTRKSLSGLDAGHILATKRLIQQKRNSVVKSILDAVAPENDIKRLVLLRLIKSLRSGELLKSRGESLVELTSRYHPKISEFVDSTTPQESLRHVLSWYAEFRHHELFKGLLDHVQAEIRLDEADALHKSAKLRFVSAFYNPLQSN